MTSNLPQKVLIVDADPGIAGPIAEPLGKMGVEIFTASNLETALYRFNKQFFKVVFIELRFPELDGMALLQKWRQHDVEEKRTAGFILVTGTAPTSEQNSLIKEMGKVSLVAKPLKAATMVSQIQKAYQAQIRQQLTFKIKKDITDKLIKKGDIRQAIEEVKEYREALGEEYLPMLLDLYQQSENFEEGLDLLKKIPTENMDPLRRLNLMGKFSLKIGRLSEAKEYLEKANSLAPKNMERIRDMTDMYLKLKQPDEAVEKQKELLEMNPEKPEMKFDMFKQLEDHGFFDEANDFCREVSGPKEVVRFFNNKGVILAQTKEPQVAIDEYNRALSYFPDNPDNYLIHFNLALAYLRTRKVDVIPKARDHLQDCLKIRPDFLKAQELLDKLLRKAG